MLDLRPCQDQARVSSARLWNSHLVEPEALAEASAFGALTRRSRLNLLIGEAESGCYCGENLVNVGELAKDLVWSGGPEFLGFLMKLRDERREEVVGPSTRISGLSPPAEMISGMRSGTSLP